MSSSNTHSVDEDHDQDPEIQIGKDVKGKKFENKKMEKWAKEHFVSKETLCILAGHGFTDLPMFSLITPDVLQEYKQEITPMAQFLALKKGLQVIWERQQGQEGRCVERQPKMTKEENAAQGKEQFRRQEGNIDYRQLDPVDTLLGNVKSMDINERSTAGTHSAKNMAYSYIDSNSTHNSNTIQYAYDSNPLVYPDWKQSNSDTGIGTGGFTLQSMNCKQSNSDTGIGTGGFTLQSMNCKQSNSDTGIGTGGFTLQSMNPTSLFLRPLADVTYLKIVDFVSPVLGSPVEDDETLINVTGGSLKFRAESKNKKPKLENISKEQWFAASLKILDKLLITKELPPSNTSDYLAYLVHITDLAQQYLWADVLMYDDSYRREQAKLRCRWGLDIPTLSRVWLQPKAHVQNRPTNGGGIYQHNHHKSQRPQKTHRSSQHNNPKGPIDPNTGQEICLAFNRGNCKFGSSCRYRHACSVVSCGQNHNAIEHPPKQ